MKLSILMAILGTVVASVASAQPKIEVVNSVPVVQQEITISDFASVCKVDSQFMEYPNSCRIANYTLGLPPGGNIVGAKSSSNMVRLSTSSDQNGLDISFLPKDAQTQSENKAEIKTAILTGQISVTLIYQGPALK